MLKIAPFTLMIVKFCAGNEIDCERDVCDIAADNLPANFSNTSYLLDDATGLESLKEYLSSYQAIFSYNQEGKSSRFFMALILTRSIVLAPAAAEEICYGDSMYSSFLHFKVEPSFGSSYLNIRLLRGVNLRCSNIHYDLVLLRIGSVEGAGKIPRSNVYPRACIGPCDSANDLGNFIILYASTTAPQPEVAFTVVGTNRTDSPNVIKIINLSCLPSSDSLDSNDSQTDDLSMTFETFFDSGKTPLCEQEGGILFYYPNDAKSRTLSVIGMIRNREMACGKQKRLVKVQLFDLHQIDVIKKESDIMCDKKLVQEERTLPMVLKACLFGVFGVELLLLCCCRCISVFGKWRSGKLTGQQEVMTGAPAERKIEKSSKKSLASLRGTSLPTLVVEEDPSEAGGTKHPEKNSTQKEPLYDTPTQSVGGAEIHNSPYLSHHALTNRGGIDKTPPSSKGPCVEQTL
ncbi:unnamed protein product [Cyprideis torosa]|uniref:Uncharacterized protein n=1 Tax=Cyprideis torosa TaxID=163714 RepID=A0A7R8WK67_9CRUS|nr:unnamed protein product [Cyprideis torosa]CAG0902758.1 unnamed protein product [Cyprideis torosa]